MSQFWDSPDCREIANDPALRLGPTLVQDEHGEERVRFIRILVQIPETNFMIKKSMLHFVACKFAWIIQKKKRSYCHTNASQWVIMLENGHPPLLPSHRCSQKKCVFVDNYKINGLNHSWNTLCFIRNETHCGRIIGCTLHQSKFLNQFRMFNEHPHCIDCQYFAFNTECLSIRDHLGKTMKAVSLF